MKNTRPWQCRPKDEEECRERERAEEEEEEEEKEIGVEGVLMNSPLKRR